MRLYFVFTAVEKQADKFLNRNIYEDIYGYVNV